MPSSDRHPTIAPTAAPAAAAPAAGFGAAAAGGELAFLPVLLRRLAERGEVRRYRKGTVLIHEGEQGDTLFIILRGRLRVFSSGERDREITYGVYGPGEYLGEMSLDGGPRSASVITMEAATCAVVTRRTLQAYIAEQPDFAFDLLAKVIRRARAATFSARQLALNDVYGRLKLLLESLADEAPGAAPGSPRPLRERLTHQAMAQRLGCSREMVSRLLKDLEQGEFLAPREGRLCLLRPLPARW